MDTGQDEGNRTQCARRVGKLGPGEKEALKLQLRPQVLDGRRHVADGRVGGEHDAQRLVDAESEELEIEQHSEGASGMRWEWELNRSVSPTDRRVDV